MTLFNSDLELDLRSPQGILGLFTPRHFLPQNRLGRAQLGGSFLEVSLQVRRCASERSFCFFTPRDLVFQDSLNFGELLDARFQGVILLDQLGHRCLQPGFKFSRPFAESLFRLFMSGNLLPESRVSLGKLADVGQEVRIEHCFEFSLFLLDPLPGGTILFRGRLAARRRAQDLA